MFSSLLALSTNWSCNLCWSWNRLICSAEMCAVWKAGTERFGWGFCFRLSDSEKTLKQRKQWHISKHFICIISLSVIYFECENQAFFNSEVWFLYMFCLYVFIYSFLFVQRTHQTTVSWVLWWSSTSMPVTSSTLMTSRDRTSHLSTERLTTSGRYCRPLYTHSWDIWPAYDICIYSTYFWLLEFILEFSYSSYIFWKIVL